MEPVCAQAALRNRTRCGGEVKGNPEEIFILNDMPLMHQVRGGSKGKGSMQGKKRDSREGVK